VQERNHTLDTALQKLRDLHLNAGQVRRVAVASQGSLQLEVADGEKHRFFVYEGNELIELLVENDTRIPLIAKLGAAGLASGHTIVSYRPGRRIVLEPARNDRATLLKAYRKNKSAQAAKNYAIALAACDGGGFDIPELLQYETRDDYLVMARRSGQTPQIAMHAIGTWEEIGACLQRFQQANGRDARGAFSTRDELLVLDERARRFLLCMPSLPEGWSASRERLESLVSDLPPARMGLTHRDLHDGQFLVDGKTVSLLDFDLICVADVALDAGNLLAHLKLRTLQGRHGNDPSALAACSDAFLSGLGRLEEPGFEKRLCFYQATSFCRLALLYALRPRWSHLCEPLILEGNRCIEAFLEGRWQS